MLELKNTLEVAERFKKYVIQQSRSNLTKGRNNVSRSLYNSLKGETIVENNYAIVGFTMDQYGQYLDEGVKGAFPNMVKNGKQKAPNSRFKFTNKKPPVEPLIKWAKARKIRLRNEDGTYKKGSYRTLGFILQKRIYAQGIKPTLFFTKPFENALKRFVDKEMEDGFVSDIDVIVDLNLK